MSISNSFSCYLIGNGAVAFRCAELLRQSGHQVLGVYSFDLALSQWALENDIEHVESLENFKQSLHSQPFDFLFSINNPWIIPSAVLDLADRLTINFHDSPLPSYSGLHATSWALINGEARHATSWHEVVRDIDAGRILKQVFFDVEEDDTALTLNRRVLDLTVESFSELLSELATGTESFSPQIGEGGSYFSLTDRPESACILCFNQEGQTLKNLVRGLDFGPQYNPLGLPKVLLPGQLACVDVSLLTIVSDKPSGSPGKILSVADEGLKVSVKDADVFLGSLRSLEGKELNADDLASLGCTPGNSLPSLPEFQRNELTKYNRQVCKYESFWRQRFTSLLPFEHPFCSRARITQEPCSYYSLESLAPFAKEFDLLFQIFAAYIVRVGNRGCQDVGVLLDDIPEHIRIAFMDIIPLQIPSVAEGESFSSFSIRLEEVLRDCRVKGSVSRDLFIRDIALKNQLSPAQLSICLGVLNDHDDLTNWHLESELTLLCFRDGSSPLLCHRSAIKTWQEESIESQLLSLASACIESPETSLYQLPLISNDEREKLIYEWNDTDKAFPDRASVDELVSLQVLKTPDAIAVRFGEDSLSYARLEERSKHLACLLVESGVKSGDLVALCLPRGVDLIVSLFAIIKSGAAYVPVDPTYPQQRIQYLLEDSAAECVLTNTSLQLKYFSTFSNVLCVDSNAQLRSTISSDLVPVEINPEGLLYVIYTSGSTGKPKGIEISHKALINHSWAIAEIYGLNSDDCMLQSASISFDVAAEQIFPALFKGACVVIRPEDLFESFKRFEHFVTEQEISVMVLPTAFWHEWSADLHLNDRSVPTSLRGLSVGTEKVTTQSLMVWEEQCKTRDVAFFQGYGPSETTVTCCMYQHKKGSATNSDEDIPIGRALPNVKLYVLDENMEVVPVGFAGELYVGGSGVGKGYRKRKDLTRQSFVENPFLSNSGRLYQTGDLARRNPDGQLVFVGRSDFQIKVRGNRVELGEIESALQDSELVKQAIVHPGLAADGSECLIAYVLAVPNEKPNPETLLANLSSRLPVFMVPDALVVLESFPMTANQKVDRNRLPIPESLCQKGVTYEAPASDFEIQIAMVWQKGLGLERVGRNDNFFDLGGNSLRAVALLDQMSAATGVSVTLNHLFSSENLAQFCRLIQDQGAQILSPVIALNAERDQKPVFFICGIHLYHALAARMSSDYSSYGVFLPAEVQLFEEKKNNSSSEQNTFSVENYAARYIEVLRSQQSSGPYRVGGASFGGVVAYEIARQLHACGEVVEFVVLFDTVLPSCRANSIYIRTKSLLKDCFLSLGTLATSFRKGLFRLVGKARDNVLHEEDIKNIRNQYYWEAMCEYDKESRPYEGKVLLFKASDRIDSTINLPLLGWENHAKGEFLSFTAEGGHIGMIKEPFVEGLAKEMINQLKVEEKAQQ